jgi:integrase
MNILEDPKIQQMIIRKKLSESRQKVYRTVLSSIYELTGKSPTELIQEAKQEEKPYIEHNQAVFIDIDDRKVKQYIYQYYNFLENKGISQSSIDSYLKTLRSFYSEYNIELPKNIQIELENNLIQDDEIITKSTIREAIETTKNLRNKAIITLMASSGMRSGDIRNLKISDFMEATKDYHDGSIDTLINSKEDIVPMWYFVPEKTRKKGNICVTFNTPETSRYIIRYIQKRHDLSMDDYLFVVRGSKLTNFGLISVFRKINDETFGRTKKGKRFFKAHSLRKFFITKCSHHSGDLRKIALLSGHAPPVKTDKNYVSINFDVMKEFYTKLIPQLSIQDTEIKTIKSKEFLKIEKRLAEKDKENLQLRAEIERNQKQDELRDAKVEKLEAMVTALIKNKKTIYKP